MGFKKQNTDLSTIQWVDEILCRAVEKRASDIHIEPERDKLYVRFRIDGLLYLVEELSGANRESIISRIKVMSQVNITEYRLPQDGHFEFEHQDKRHNIRVSTFPTIYGEAVVMRILNRDTGMLQIEELGFDQDQLEVMHRLIASPYGMVMITGPSGSGKTTLLYSILNSLNRVGSSVITLEDPVELQMSNIRQMQVNETIGLDFSKGLRAVLRQDPNVIMVGEIRDAETAQMAIQAALTGILVFTTFHTLDVPGVIMRFVEMGIPRSVIAHAISGIISSRLVRKVCPHCQQSSALSKFEASFLEAGSHDAQTIKAHDFRKGQGCEACMQSGYYDRIGFFEVVDFDDDIRTTIFESSSVTNLKKTLENKKMKTLHEAAIDKVMNNVTTVSEVIRVIGLNR